MEKGSLESTGDDTLEQAKAVINLLARAERYRSGSNSVGMGKTIGIIFRWFIPPLLVSMAITVVIGLTMGTNLTREGHPVLYWATAIISVATLVISSIILTLVLGLLWKHRAGLHENEAHHLRSGYLLHEGQVRALAVYPLPVLQSVNRYFERRPLAGRGVHMAFLGKSELTFTTFALALSVVKQLYDLHALKMTANGDVVSVVWLSLVSFLYLSVLMRGFRRKEDYQRGLLSDAITMLTEGAGLGDKACSVQDPEVGVLDEARTRVCA